MTIHSISKSEGTAVVELSSTELVQICNHIYRAKKSEKIDRKLYAQMMIARDLSQYGHIDGFSFDRLSECYKEVAAVE